MMGSIVRSNQIEISRRDDDFAGGYRKRATAIREAAAKLPIVFVVATGHSLSIMHKNGDFVFTTKAAKGCRARIHRFIRDEKLVVDGRTKQRFPWLAR